MIAARRLSPDARAAAFGARSSAHALAALLPAAMVAAREAASTLTHGAHGRRRAGPGDAFWQFRAYAPGESAARIDWRRSARDDRLFVREREWEAAHAVHIWIDRSPSMAFGSPLAMQSKLSRALTLGLAAAQLVVRAGERAALMGLTAPSAPRDAIEHFGRLLLEDERARPDVEELAPAIALPPRARCLVVTDGLSAPEAFAQRLLAIAARGARGCVIQVVDPVEETFPFEGNVELRDLDSAARLRAGRAQSWREDYCALWRAHRAALGEACRAAGFAFLVNHTDKPATTTLLSMRNHLEAH